MIITKKTIEIAGWLSEREIGQGKTAVWTGNSIEDTLIIDDNYYWGENEIEQQLAAAQAEANRLILQNGWPIICTAFVQVYTFDTADFE